MEESDEISANLVSKGFNRVVSRVVLAGVGILAIPQLELRIVFDLVQENHSTVRQETSMHGRYTSLSYNLKGTRIG